MAGKRLSRRKFIADAAAASIAFSMTGVSGSLFAQLEEKPVRIGFVGVGNRGTAPTQGPKCRPTVEGYGRAGGSDLGRPAQLAIPHRISSTPLKTAGRISVISISCHWITLRSGSCSPKRK